MSSLDSHQPADTATAALRAWTAELNSELKGLADVLLLRACGTHQGRVDFSSNDYLSLNASGKLGAWLRELAADWKGPAGSTGSRLIRGHYAEFEQAESDFANYRGGGAALFFHSGYAANLGTLQALLGGRDHVFCDRLCHASLLDGIRLSGARRYYFEHNDWNDLEQKLGRYQSARGRNWIVTESVFSMDGDQPELASLCELAEQSGALIYLDEAHAVGMLGPKGAGLAAGAFADRVAVAVYPMGKAPGLMGAFVCGSPTLRDYLVNRARSFIFSTAQPPLLAALMSRVIEHLRTTEAEQARARVLGLADQLRKRVLEIGLSGGQSTTQIVPIPAGSEERALTFGGACREAGLDARAIRPPSVPRGTSRLRVTLQANHTEDNIEELIAVLAKLV